MSQREAVRLEIEELGALRAEIERQAAAMAPRWNADPEEVQKSVGRLGLAVVEFLRKLMEKQAIRRMEAATLTEEETENVALALMKLEETLHETAGRFGPSPEELN